MGILSRVESFLERFLEAPAGRLGASIQPVSLAKRIERAMDTNKTYRDSGVIVPNHYAPPPPSVRLRRLRVVPQLARG